ncbi:MAG: LPS export ABC transporter periplasmic protein LptC [Bacteroidota bacterium]|nr:LPS export ABC transporter periplasmic protein LptC [Bacteroidota bacterium]
MNNSISIVRNYICTAAFITGCCFVCGCENDMGTINNWTKRVTKKDEARDVISYLSQEGIMKAKLTAPLMYRVSSDTVYAEFPNTLHIDFYDDSTKIDTRLDCKYAKYFENLDKAYLRDSVIVISVKGDTLKAPDLWWDQRTKLFYTDKYAEYHAKGKNIYGGKGLEAAQDMSTVTFKEPTGVVQVSDSGVLQ